MAFRSIDIRPLARQIEGHLRSNSYSSADLADMTGEHIYDVIDALAWLMGKGRVTQTHALRYRCTIVGRDSPEQSVVPLPRPGPWVESLPTIA